ncbi:MAG: SLBB domain-containing protein [Acetobacterales bacterium]
MKGRGWRRRSGRAIRNLATAAALLALLQQPSPASAQGALDNANLGDMLTLMESAPGSIAREPITPTNPVDAARVAARRSAARQQGQGTEGQRPRPPEQRPLSPIEQAYSIRANEVVRLFGYDLIERRELDPFARHGTSDSQSGMLMSGAIPDNYVLGIGDELVITMRGQQSRTLKITVDREGRVVLPDLPPIPAAGRRFENFREDLEQAVAESFIGTSVFISVGSVRSVGIFVSGEVERPGLHRLPGLSSVLQSLVEAEGVKPTGSLRRIRLVRRGDTRPLDLYEILLQGGQTDFDLNVADGDRLVVPTLGNTLAVIGQVKRPGIYEMPEGAERISLAEAVELAGGPLFSRGNRYLVQKLDDVGRDVATELSDPGADTVTDGTIVNLLARNRTEVGVVDLRGHVKVPGSRALAANPSLAYLVPDPYVLERDPYLLFGVLQRTDSETRVRRFYPVNLKPVLARAQDYRLQDQDRLIVLGREDIRFLASRDVQQTLLGLTPRRAPQAVAGAVTGADAGAGGGQNQDQQGAGEGSRGLGSRTLLDQQRARDIESLLDARPLGNEQQDAAGTGTASGTRDSGAQRPFRAAGEGLTASELTRAESAGLCRGINDLARLVAAEGTRRFATAVRATRTSERAVTLQEAQETSFFTSGECPRIFNEFPNLLPFLLENAVGVSGEVREPGVYPVVPGTAFDSLLAVARGTTRDANLANVVLTRPASGATDQSLTRTTLNLADAGAAGIAVDPGDALRFNASPSDREIGPVFLIGQFELPGAYDISRGETLLSVIQRAGGLTEQAYPFGAVISRPSVQQRERDNVRRAIEDLREAIATNVLRSTGTNAEDAAQVIETVATSLRQQPILGRVVAEADPDVLQVRPELDTVLEPGDRIVMPKRPNWVAVSGAVLSTGALQFSPGTTADGYVRMAGGFAQNADEDRAFVIFPNGQAQPLALSPWNFEATQIPPGSTIFVPRDATPFDIYRLARETTGILSQLAVTAASLSVISNN